MWCYNVTSKPGADSTATVLQHGVLDHRLQYCDEYIYAFKIVCLFAAWWGKFTDFLCDHVDGCIWFPLFHRNTSILYT